MAEYPSGTITFLFTDIEGSTSLWERFPEAMKRVVLRHHELLREAIDSQQGQIFRYAGDGICSAFRYPAQALQAAVEAQRSLQQEAWEIDAPLRVCMALHSGAAEFRQGDYLGASLNHISRLLPVGHGGQILLTMATEELIHDQLPEGISLRDLGQHHFRDLSRPEHIFQVIVPGLPIEFPPLKSRVSYPNNLPTPATSFIGRVKELSEVKALIVHQRLVTLTGPGGTGKTRLALRAGSEALEAFPDGVWLVELAPLINPDLILKNIANILHLREQPNQPLQELLAETLRSKEIMIILDNCEHLIEHCAIIADQLVNACPHLHILISSREPLGISGEAIYRVPSLSLPPQERIGALEEIEKYEAIRLFIDRAVQVDPQFALTSQNATSVVQVCRRLDGIPLAIELAAARTKLLSAEQIALRLDDRFRLLTGGSRTALPRQQTLRALIDWSYDLLTEPECDLLRQLSVFSGGWTIEAAEAICQMEEGYVLDLLDQLVNKSLVNSEQQGEEMRYHMLETIRQYAGEKLFDSGSVEMVRNRHLEYFSTLSKDVSVRLDGPEDIYWMDKLEREIDNFRSALKWGLDHQPLQAIQIASNLELLWSRRAYGNEGVLWLQELLEQLSTRKEAIGEADYLLWRARALASQGVILLSLGGYQQVISLFLESIHIFKQIQDTENIGIPLGLLGLVYALTGDYSQARKYAEEVIRVAKLQADELRYGLGLNVLGQVELFREDGNLELAQSYLEESLTQLQSVRSKYFINSGLYALGLLAIKKGDFATARKYLQEDLENTQAIGNLHFANVTRSSLAALAFLESDYQNSIQLYQETLQEWSKLGNQGAVARCLECISFILIKEIQDGHTSEIQKLVTRSAQLLGVAESIRNLYSAPMMPVEYKEYEQYIQILKEVGTENEINPAWREGRKMSLDQAVNFALSLPNLSFIDK